MGAPNVANSSKYTVAFSNIPTLDLIKDLNLYDWYVKSCTLPDYNIMEMYSDFQRSRIRHVGSRLNDDITPLQIEFKLSEDGMNYFNLVYFMVKLRAGELTSQTVRDNLIKRIDFILLDNQKREKLKIYFTKAFPISVSSLNMGYGEDEEVSFTVTFTYDEMFPEVIA